MGLFFGVVKVSWWGAVCSNGYGDGLGAGGFG